MRRRATASRRREEAARAERVAQACASVLARNQLVARRARGRSRAPGSPRAQRLRERDPDVANAAARRRRRAGFDRLAGSRSAGTGRRGAGADARRPAPTATRERVPPAELQRAAPDVSAAGRDACRRRHARGTAEARRGSARRRAGGRAAAAAEVDAVAAQRVELTRAHVRERARSARARRARHGASRAVPQRLARRPALRARCARRSRALRCDRPSRRRIARAASAAPVASTLRSKAASLDRLAAGASRVRSVVRQSSRARCCTARGCRRRSATSSSRFCVDALPRAPGAALLAWVAVTLAAVLMRRLLFNVSLRAGQMRLARQQQDFVSAVSHELKTPLTSIRMYGEMLKAGWADDAKTADVLRLHPQRERAPVALDRERAAARAAHAQHAALRHARRDRRRARGHRPLEGRARRSSAPDSRSTVRNDDAGRRDRRRRRRLRGADLHQSRRQRAEVLGGRRP